MSFWITALSMLFLAGVATGVVLSRRGGAGPKRRSLFENADGERTVPFAAITDGAAARDRCTECGATLDSLSKEFCVSCGMELVGDD